MTFQTGSKIISDLTWELVMSLPALTWELTLIVGEILRVLIVLIVLSPIIFGALIVRKIFGSGTGSWDLDSGDGDDGGGGE